MPRPIFFETVLTRARIVEELDAIEAEVVPSELRARAFEVTSEGVERLRELRKAIAHKPMDIDPQ